MKTCPYCAEEIQDAAVVCRHCGRDVPTTLGVESSAPSALEMPARSTSNPIWLWLGLASAAAVIVSTVLDWGTGFAPVDFEANADDFLYLSGAILYNWAPPAIAGVAAILVLTGTRTPALAGVLLAVGLVLLTSALGALLEIESISGDFGPGWLLFAAASVGITLSGAFLLSLRGSESGTA